MKKLPYTIEIKKGERMKKTLVLTAVISALILCCWGTARAQAIENELYLITPVSKDVHDPVLKAFEKYAKSKWNIDVKTSAIPKGTPVAYGQIIEWKGNPQADIFWGGEGTLFDDLATRGLLEKIQLPKKMWDEIPAAIGKPVLSPFQFAKQVEQALDQYVRPQLRRDGGDLELVDVKDTAIFIQLKGACAGVSSIRFSVLLPAKGSVISRLPASTASSGSWRNSS